MGHHLMNTQPLVEIFCDGNQQVGFGHIRRSSSLAEQLIKDGIDVRLSGLSARARTMLPAPEYVGRKASIVVFDSFTGIDTLIQEAIECRQITVTLDWFGETVPDVNIAVYPHSEVYAKQTAYIGFEYILIRDEITSLRWEKPIRRSGNVIICIGGGDMLAQGHIASRRLSEQDIDVTLVQGPLSNKTDISLGYRVLDNPPRYPRLLAECDWAVTNGGGSLFEALCLGKAVFVLPQSDAEMKIAEFVLDKGAILGIGIDNLRVFLPDELIHVAESGVKLVDGRGAERISSIIKGLL